MVAKNMSKIFLSAGIPDLTQDQKYVDTADVIAIRDAVRALATVIMPHSMLIWGGHPAITPLIRYVLQNVMKLPVQNHVTLYQSEFYKEKFPDDNQYFETIVITPKKVDEQLSLDHMRTKMITEHTFDFGIFIGGMSGVEKEFIIFKEAHPNTPVLPVASTGAAAKIIYDQITPPLDKRLLNDFAYMAMFKSLLNIS